MFLGGLNIKKLKLIDDSYYPFIPTICECGCNEIIFYSKKKANYKVGHYARVNHPKNRLGCKSSEKTKRKLRGSFSGSKNPMYGITPSYKAQRGFGSHYDSPLQGKIWLRSSYELAYAKYLDSIHELWLYEMETFELTGEMTYTPDFFLPKQEKFIEIKGYLYPDQRIKIERFREEYPWDLEVLFREDLIKIGGVK